MEMMDRSLTLGFAEKICSAKPANNEAAMNAAKKGLIDYIASCFAGREDPGVNKLLSIIEQEGGHQQIPIIGQDCKATISQASLVNGYLGHALDFDDVHSDVRGHPSTVILPALLSLSGDSSISGSRFLQAYIIGVEVMARLGKGIGNNHYLQGWHNTCTLGVIAAAAAGSFLKELSPIETAKVIGLAATQASGLRNQFGTETKPLHAGIAAKSAVFAVQLTISGFNGTESGLDGDMGFFHVYGNGEKAAEDFLLNNWGDSWKIVTPGLWFKLYPFCSAAYHGADAALSVANKIPNPAEMEKIHILFPPGGDAALIHRHPSTGEQGRFSIEYVVALALLGYSFSLENFKNEPIRPDILHLMSRMERKYDSTIKAADDAVPAGRFTIIEMNTKDGQTYRSRVDYPKGSPNNPVSLSELKVKLAQTVAEEARSQSLLQTIEFLEKAPNIKNLISLL